MSNQASNKPLDNKVIIVTGSTAGIGFGIAKLALEKGGKVAIHGSSEGKAKEAYNKLSKSYDPNNILAVFADITDSTSADKIVKTTINKFRKLDGIVNNAGIFPRDNIGSISDESFDEIFTINAKFPLQLIQKALPYLKKNTHESKSKEQFLAQNSKSIVNIGSINAYQGQKDLLVYSMSKGALMTMTRNLGDTLFSENNIRVNQLNIGWTFTEKEDLTQKKLGFKDGWQKSISKVFAPSGNLLKPCQIAQHVCFWLSEDSWPISGQVYEIEQYPIIGRNKIAE